MIAELIAQGTESSALYTYGPLGVFCSFLMWREINRQNRETAREVAREATQAAREAAEEERNRQRDVRSDDMVQAIHHLTRALSLEVLTRPSVVQRARDEAQELSDLVGRK